MTRPQRLTHLRDMLYSANNRLDGCYNSEDEDFSDLKEINDRYEKLIKELDSLRSLVNKAIDK